jgi:hypothetical protein
MSRSSSGDMGADGVGCGEGGVGYGYGLGVGGISDMCTPPGNYIKSYYIIVFNRLYNVYLHMLTITDKP